MSVDELGDVRRAISKLDWESAIASAERAASLLDDDSRAAADLADLYAEALWWLGRLDDCIAGRERAYALYERLGERRQAGQCAVWLWEHNSIAARPAAAGAWLRRARASLEDDVDCVEHVAWRLREAEVTHGSGDLNGALDEARQCLSLARALPRQRPRS